MSLLKEHKEAIIALTLMSISTVLSAYQMFIINDTTPLLYGTTLLLFFSGVYIGGKDEK